MKAKVCGLHINEHRKELYNVGSLSFPCMIFDNVVDATKSIEIPWHWHEEIELIVVNKGTLQLHCNEEHFLLKKGDGAFINANVLHLAQAQGKEACDFDSLLFHPQLLSGVVESVFEQSFIRPMLQSTCPAIIFDHNQPWGKEAIQAITHAFDLYEEESFGHEMLIRNCLSQLWILMMEHIPSSYTISSQAISSDIIRIKAMIDFIQVHYATSLTLHDIANVAMISERECLRCFQKTLGISPFQYVLKYRISIATKHLQESSDSITKISASVGFDSPSYFGSIFKRWMLCTPSEYRKTSKAN